MIQVAPQYCRASVVAAWLAIMPALSICATARADDEPTMQADKQALAPLQPYVGQWRGVGLPKRGSNQGAWTERSAWSWRFRDGHAELVGELDGDKYFDRLEIRPGEKAGTFVVLAAAEQVSEEGAGSGVARYTGELADSVLKVAADKPGGKLPARITVRLVAGGDRMLVLYEKELGDGVFTRLAEVGSTREGSSFAKSATSGPECVVTGGLGTIAVEYEGKTYYVCCGGCRDLFNEDPAGVLAEFRERKAAERTKKE